MKRVLATLFYFNGLLLLLFVAARLRSRIAGHESDALPYVVLTIAGASLLTILYQATQPFLSRLGLVIVHALWILSAITYVWLCNDPLISFGGDQVEAFSADAMRELRDAVSLRQLGVSVYVLISTTGLYWVLATINGSGQSYGQQAKSPVMSKLLLISIAAMLIGVGVAWVRPLGGSAPIAAGACGVALLLASTGASNGGQVAWGVGVAEALTVAFLTALM